MKTYQDCIVLNAQAIAMIQSGRCEEGIHCIKNALAVLQPHLETPAEEAIQKKVNNRPYYSVPVMEDYQLRQSRLLSSENIFTFYPRMFNITEFNPANFGPHKVFVVLLFNLAIAHHMHAALLHQNDDCMSDDSQNSSSMPWSCMEVGETAESRTFRLTTILKMYQSVILATRTSLHPDEVGSLLCILIAAANNAGHLNSCLHNFQEMQSSLNLEMQLLGLSYGPCAIPDPDYEIFFSSVFVFLEGPGLCLSPAA